METSTGHFGFPRFYSRRRPPVTTANPSPIHERHLIINPQSESYLYNGRIPAEIRNTIFDYALTEHLVGGEASSSEYLKNTHYTRPNYQGKKTISTALLRICRLTYLETYRLPFANKEFVFYHARGPPFHAGSTLAHYGEQEIRYFNQFKPWQMALIKDIHIFAQAFWLENVFLRLCRRDFMQGIEKIKITLRRGDWWYWENNDPLAISPKSGSIKAGPMHREWSLEQRGVAVEWRLDQWGAAFAEMKGLKQLEMDLETSDDKIGELKAIAANALTWKFPAQSQGNVEMVLSSNGSKPKWMTWEGPMCYWSDSCPQCGQHTTCLVADPPNEGCVERARRKAADRGPLCHVVSLRWKVSRKHARD